MKVVINQCWGGFGLSPRAIKRLAELNGRECYFFVNPRQPYDINKYVPITLEALEGDPPMMWHAFDIPNPNEVCAFSDNWHSLSMEEREKQNKNYENHCFMNGRELDRADPKLVQVVEELGAGHGTGASGKLAYLQIVEIPDGVDYDIEEYDGMEHIAEKHRTWR